MAGQHLRQGRAERALPDLDLGGIAAEALQCRPALVAPPCQDRCRLPLESFV